MTLPSLQEEIQMKPKRQSIVAKGGSQQSRKPPPATRHRAVMSLRQAVALYDMRSHPSSTLQDVLESSRNAEKVMLVSTVSTNKITRLQDNPSFVELGITFYPGDTLQEKENQRPKLDVNVVMPQGWSPKMYVAALNKSIRRHSIISLESFCIKGRIYATVNELQWLFSAKHEDTHSRLVSSASYIRVSGGVFK
jgi:hypothetical protein